MQVSSSSRLRSRNSTAGMASTTPALKAGKTTSLRNRSLTGRMTTSTARSLRFRVFLGDQRVDLGRALGGEDRGAERGVLEQPADAGERLQVQPGGVLGRDQGEEQVGGL